jgi:hypothetical protein
MNRLAPLVLPRSALGSEGLPPPSQPRQYGAPLSIAQTIDDYQNITRGGTISTTGANEDTPKVRPPLVCQAEHVELFLLTMQHTSLVSRTERRLVLPLAKRKVEL